jgi:hypothetical protein
VIFIRLIQSASSLPTDTSTLQGSIAALENAVSALESEIKTLESSSVPWEHSVWVFTFLVLVGVALELWIIRHEYRDDVDAWELANFVGVLRSPSRPSTAKLVVEVGSVLLITIGIMGELGAGIRIASINGKLRGMSAQLRSKNAEVRSKSDQLLALVTAQAGTAKASAEKAAAASGRAESDAERAKNKADNVARLAKQLHEFLTPRSLTQKEMDDLRDSLKPLADPNVPILVTGSWESGLAIQVWSSLKLAGFEKAQFQLIQGPVPYGMGASSPLKHGYLTGEIVAKLMKVGIGPEVGVQGITADTEPIKIFIGDIRTAPLPTMK